METSSLQQPPEAIVVWVSVEGTWSCSPSTFFKLPTELFDYNMLIGRLNTTDDLQLLVEKASNDKIIYADSECTDVYVNQGNWSGSPSIRFEIPPDVFMFLQHARNNTENLIGNLSTQESLINLIEKVRFEIINGIPLATSTTVVSSRLPNNELKICTHMCTTSSVKDECCVCADRRPFREDGTYPMYVDGEGWADKASRGAGYCPICRY